MAVYGANRSFAEGKFPTSFKHATVTPLLKKPSLDKNSPSSYRPISNLIFISKILERLCLARIQSHILSSPNFNQFQSAYRRHYSTETSLLYTLSNIFRSSDSGKSTLLISLDLYAAFDTIDHHTLISHLNTSFGLSGSVLNWFSSYLSNRTQSVCIGRYSSKPHPCTTGVPQGSVLGPLLFKTYTSPIAAIARSFNICQQQYADDTQLWIALSPADLASSITSLTSCLLALQTWFCQNGMALNPDKTEAILFGTRQRLLSFSDLSSVNAHGVHSTS